MELPYHCRPFGMVNKNTDLKGWEEVELNESARTEKIVLYRSAGLDIHTIFNINDAIGDTPEAELCLEYYTDDNYVDGVEIIHHRPLTKEEQDEKKKELFNKFQENVARELKSKAERDLAEYQRLKKIFEDAKDNMV